MWHELLRRYIEIGEERCLQDALEKASDSDTRDLFSTYISAGPDRYIDRLTEWLSDRPEPYTEPGERTIILLEYFLHACKAADRSLAFSEEQLRQGLEMAKEDTQLSQALSAQACEGRFQAFRGRIHWRVGEYEQALNALGAAIELYREDSGSDGSHLLPTREGLDRYALRKSIIEPVNGQIKEIGGFRRFSLWGYRKARREWALICTGHNLKKLIGAMQSGQCGGESLGQTGSCRLPLSLG